ncbi:hypothetical protein OIU74_014325, partial [Salix koriyanagi]
MISAELLGWTSKICGLD